MMSELTLRGEAAFAAALAHLRTCENLANFKPDHLACGDAGSPWPGLVRRGHALSRRRRQGSPCLRYHDSGGGMGDGEPAAGGRRRRKGCR